MRPILLLLGIVACGGDDDDGVRSQLRGAIEELRGACEIPPPTNNGTTPTLYDVGYELGQAVCINLIDQYERCVNTADDPMDCVLTERGE